MGAVGEPAPGRPLLQVTKYPGQRLLGVPDPNGTDAWGVDQQPTAGPQDQFPANRRVAALGVARADLPGFQDLVTDQSVDER